MDDIALVVIVHTSKGLEDSVNDAFTWIIGWMSSHGIELAHAKTETFMLTQKWSYRQP